MLNRKEIIRLNQKFLLDKKNGIKMIKKINKFATKVGFPSMK